jgi:two-component system phosphate regulon sensor histidine kinase PhoR
VLEAHASPITTAGTDAGPDGAAPEPDSGLVIVLHDITELRRLERVRRDFVANVSHELKTPLAAIRGFVETLLSGAQEEADVRERFLQRIDDNVSRLSHLVTDLLSLARIEGQAQSIQRVPVELGEVVAAVAERARGTADRKGLTLEVRGCDERLSVLGDAEGLTQIANNLLENAINYTPAPGTVTVRVSQKGGRGVLEVEDTGVGIPRDDLRRIFERFYRVDRARSRELGGTGLGLSIVRNLVQAMHGQVHVESEVGRGSVFRVEIPLA